MRWDKEKGNFSFYTDKFFDGSQALRNFLFNINTSENEKGPYTLSNENQGIILFSRDNAEGVYSILSESQETSSQEIDPAEVSFRLLDDEASEMYPSFYGPDFLKGAGDNGQGRPEKMLFSSDRDGAFD
ncbi:hypothetical protein, partial [Algoriphagus sp.]|uniref:hypothetical protein n=1 Tax=Algoriphagus sp. TaxID=1872435 RepID=UPI00262E0283